jgi:hypothetical protein
MSGRCSDALGTVQGESCCETFLRMSQSAWTTRTLMLAVVGSMLMACTSEEPEPEKPSVSAFCAAVERAPKDDVSVAETQAAAADVEGVSPPEIRDEVIALRDALDAVTTESEMNGLFERGSPIRPVWRRYHEYIEINCVG